MGVQVENLEDIYGFVYAGQDAEGFTTATQSADSVFTNLYCEEKATKVMTNVLIKEPQNLVSAPQNFC